MDLTTAPQRKRRGENRFAQFLNLPDAARARFSSIRGCSIPRLGSFIRSHPGAILNALSRVSGTGYAHWPAFIVYILYCAPVSLRTMREICIFTYCNNIPIDMIFAAMFFHNGKRMDINRMVLVAYMINNNLERIRYCIYFDLRRKSIWDYNRNRFTVSWARRRQGQAQRHVLWDADGFPTC